MSIQNLNLEEESVQEFKNGLFCSEAILQVFNRRLDLGLNKTALKMATGFGAGLGASKCCCGSLTGAVLVLSALKGREETKDSVEEVFRLTNELHDRFKERFKATCCRVLTRTVEWGAPEHHQLCKDYVRGAVEILTDILDRDTQPKEA